MNRIHPAPAATLALAGHRDTGKLVPVTENHATLVVDQVALMRDSCILANSKHSPRLTGIPC